MKPVTIYLAIVLACSLSVQAQNRVVFENQSGEPATVKLIGPTFTEIQVPNSKTEPVQALAGTYYIKVRYGTSGNFHYAKGQKFTVDETATSTSEITIILHKVVNGNYESSPITEHEFGLSNFSDSAPVGGAIVAGGGRRGSVADMAHYDGFVLAAKHSVKSGDAIPVLVVGESSGLMSVLSVEADERMTEPSKAEPWFSAFPEAATTNERAAAVEAWRIEKGYVASTLDGTSFAGTMSVKVKPSAANKAFACCFVQVEGETFAALTSEGGAKSRDTMAVADGAKDVQYPLMANLKCSDGNFRIVFPALLRSKANINSNAGAITIPPSITIPNDSTIIRSELIPGSARSSLWCRKYDTYNRYLRFYSGGTVVAVSVGGTGTPSESWFNESYKDSDQYTIIDSSVKFSIGNYDYDGVIQGTSLILKVHSLINHAPSSQDHYELVQ